jgi:hypothetical protein
MHLFLDFLQSSARLCVAEATALSPIWAIAEVQSAYQVCGKSEGDAGDKKKLSICCVLLFLMK